MIVFFAASVVCFLLASVAIAMGLSPKPWRRRYQRLFERHKTRRINRNKRIDEAIASLSMRLVVVLLFFAIMFAFAGMFGPKFSTLFEPPPPRPTLPGLVPSSAR